MGWMNGSVNLSSPWMNGMNGSVQCKFSVDGWNECNCKISVLRGWIKWMEVYNVSSLWMNGMNGTV